MHGLVQSPLLYKEFAKLEEALRRFNTFTMIDGCWGHIRRTNHRAWLSNKAKEIRGALVYFRMMKQKKNSPLFTGVFQILDPSSKIGQ